MKTILVIDDDEAILAIYGLVLRHAGYNVITAEAGAEGVELARRHLPDLILCDINMPGMDGQNVLRALREDAAVGPKQIVLMTGNIRSITPRDGMALGADDFLVKPIGNQELLRCVEARLRRAQLHWRVEDRVVADLRSSLQSTLPHEFFTPLAGMVGLVEVLRGDLAQLKPEEITEMLDEIERSGWRLHRTLKNYLSALDLEAGVEVASPATAVVPASRVATALTAGIDAAMKRQKRQADLTTRIDPAAVFGFPEEISAIVEELVDNACSFSRRGTPIEVGFDATGKLTVTDQGRGMSAEQQNAVGAFRQFDRKKYEQQGLGLGLMIVRKLATRCGASFTLESQEGAGTRALVAFARPAAS